MEKELEDQGAVVVERALHRVDFVDGLLKGRAVQMAAEGAVGHFLHHVGHEKREFAVFRNVQQVAADKGVGLFLLRGLVKGLHLKKPRIDILDQPGQHRPLSGGAPAFKNHHNRQLGRRNAQLVLAQAFFQRLAFGV